MQTDKWGWCLFEVTFLSSALAACIFSLTFNSSFLASTFVLSTAMTCTDTPTITIHVLLLLLLLLLLMLLGCTYSHQVFLGLAQIAHVAPRNRPPVKCLQQEQQEERQRGDSKQRETGDTKEAWERGRDIGSCSSSYQQQRVQQQEVPLSPSVCVWGGGGLSLSVSVCLLQSLVVSFCLSLSPSVSLRFPLTFRFFGSLARTKSAASIACCHSPSLMQHMQLLLFSWTDTAIACDSLTFFKCFLPSCSINSNSSKRHRLPDCRFSLLCCNSCLLLLFPAAATAAARKTTSSSSSSSRCLIVYDI